MSNTIAIAVLVVILGLFVADHLWLRWQTPLMADGLIEYLSFWR